MQPLPRNAACAMLEGATLYDLQGEALALAGLMLLAMTLAVRRFRRTLD